MRGDDEEGVAEAEAVGKHAARRRSDFQSPLQQVVRSCGPA